MKHRHIPFGYIMELGMIQTHETESLTVETIFNDYCKGVSLKTISEQLTLKGTEYLPGKSNWNKNRIKRILEDKRYLGNNIYPAIISEKMFRQAEEVKNRKSEMKQMSESDIYSFLDSPVVCKSCGTEMKRYHDKRSNPPQRWRCKNADCGTIICIEDNEFVQKVKEIFNSIAQDPKLIPKVKVSVKTSLEVMRMSNDIARILDGHEIDRDQATNMIFECASKKYSEIDNVPYITYQLRASFEKAKNIMSEFDKKLFQSTISQIILDSNNEVKLVLKNGQIIGGLG